MVDVDECVKDFLRPKKILVYSKKYGWEDKFVFHTRGKMKVIIFNSGNGVAIIDMVKFSKLPKSRQDKFLRLCK